MTLISDWRYKKSWTPLSTDRDEELETEKKLLAEAGIDSLSRSPSNDGEIKWLTKPKPLKSHKRSMILLVANILLLCASLFINRSFLFNENYCVRQTSYYCTYYPLSSTINPQIDLRTNFESPPHRSHANSLTRHHS